MADYVSALTGTQMDQSLLDMAQHTSEAWAVGERNGVPVTSGDDTYENNAKYWAEVSRAVSANGGEISDPNNDGHLVITTPDPSDDWAVRVDSPQTLTEAEKAQGRENIGAGTRSENLLMNPWFTVNQRALTSGNHSTYPADRWRATYGTGGVSWSRESDGCITFGPTNTASHGDLYQKLPSDLVSFLGGKDITVSVMMQDGTVYSGSSYFPTASTRTYIDKVSVDDTSARMSVYIAATGEIYVQAFYGNLTVKAVKLELGLASTLANDAPPDYGAELAKCQSYFLPISITSTTDPFAFGVAYDTTSARCFIPIPATFKSTPTVTYTNIGNISIRQGNAGKAATGVSFAAAMPNGVILNFASSGLTQYGLCVLGASGSATINLSADL